MSAYGPPLTASFGSRTRRPKRDCATVRAIFVSASRPNCPSMLILRRRTAFARAVRNASRGVGSARHPVAQASACNAPWTSLNMVSERFVVRTKERAARSIRQPAFSIACTVRSPAWAGSVSDSEQGRVGPVHARVRLNPRVVFGLRGGCREGKYSLRGRRRMRRGITRQGDM
ncbi:hypothetical protein BJV74DRAFT_332775 [Russula compacta]|nr:hypothetical protein BJV74DRAFT_332775 [Russula compacta]